MKTQHLSRWLRWAACALAILIYSAAYGQASAPGSQTEIGLLKYQGGGDWYSAARALHNLISFVRDHTNVRLAPEPVAVEPSSLELFSHPIIFINGHGNVSFSEDDVRALRAYFAAGGFLFANDDYGMDASFRRELKKVLPESEFIELPFHHPIYHAQYDFPNGTPKIHEHDKLPAQGFGVFLNGVMVCYYNYQADLCDGWEDESVHGDPPAKRQAALEMGTNVILYALSRGVQ
ncbi:MAG: DUF4159 domain-containing protein [Calditrichota bacterium]